MKRTLPDLFEESVHKYPDLDFLLEKIGDQWTKTTFHETRAQVLALGAGFKSAGVKPKDNIALLSEGRNGWIIGELAMFYAGAVNVPLSVKLEESNDLLFRLLHSETKFILVSKGQLNKIRKIRDQLPLLQQIFVLDDLTEYESKEIPVSTLIAKGKAYLENHLEEFLEISRSITNDDIATITYTSGTTADPKGIMLTHRNYTANVEQALTLVQIDSTARTLIILPLDHCFAHVVGFYIFMSVGASVATVQNGKTPMETLRNIPINLKEIQPNILLSVPALAKNFRKSIESGIKAKGKTAERLFEVALKTAYIYNREGYNRGESWRILLSPAMLLFDRILFRNIRKGLCENLRFFIGGGALLDKDLQDFYYAIGIPMFQGYGLSEATPVLSSNTPAAHKFGSSGKLVRPLELVIKDGSGKILPQGEKGEIVVKGENVMAGYWKNETATKESVRDGWLHTGDLGYLDEEGFLVVLGRFKSLLIASDGEKYSPEGIEEALVSYSPYIDQIMLYNNQNNYTSALIVPNKENLKKKTAHLANPEEITKQAVSLIAENLNEFKGKGKYAGMFPERWLPAAFAVLPEPFSEQNQMINSTMKMVRGKIEKHYDHVIGQLYTAEGKKPDNNYNRESFRKMLLK